MDSITALAKQDTGAGAQGVRRGEGIQGEGPSKPDSARNGKPAKHGSRPL